MNRRLLGSVIARLKGSLVGADSLPTRVVIVRLPPCRSGPERAGSALHGLSSVVAVVATEVRRGRWEILPGQAARENGSVDTIWDSLVDAAGMFWETLWALVL